MIQMKSNFLQHLGSNSTIEKHKNSREIFSEYTDSITLNVRQHIIDTLSPFFTNTMIKYKTIYNLEELTESTKSGKLTLH